jgi:hypothetical protein
MVRPYLPKGTDLFVYSQEQLDAIVHEVNNRPSQGPWGKSFTGGLQPLLNASQHFSFESHCFGLCCLDFWPPTFSAESWFIFQKS